MENVHPGRAGAGEAGGHTTERAGLGGVRVHDVRPEAAHGADQPKERAIVIGRLDRSAEARDPMNLQRRVQELKMVAFGAIDISRIEATVEFIGVEPPVQSHD
ncbi:hypothetical protein GCM10023193_18840 [Planotetraspora kaengkrachanensis]|uniref:Uncharacterized protein n=1 Tax=Planotetraspora kaengkrachanensis TaxID=575193 RepID=A0A8J3PSM6_9ACTN|nr:hypothetical protein Pka01_27660 [Planotetraspora kaengkrachanensis]